MVKVVLKFKESSTVRFISPYYILNIPSLQQLYYIASYASRFLFFFRFLQTRHFFKIPFMYERFLSGDKIHFCRNFSKLSRYFVWDKIATLLRRNSNNHVYRKHIVESISYHREFQISCQWRTGGYAVPEWTKQYDDGATKLKNWCVLFFRPFNPLITFFPFIFHFCSYEKQKKEIKATIRN